MMNERCVPFTGAFAIENDRVTPASGKRQIDILARPEFHRLVEFDFKQPDVMGQRRDAWSRRQPNSFTAIEWRQQVFVVVQQFDYDVAVGQGSAQ